MARPAPLEKAPRHDGVSMVPSRPCRPLSLPRHVREFRRKSGDRGLRRGGMVRIYRLAQFRTCLWPRAGWWASGQEAGQPPGVLKDRWPGRVDPSGRHPGGDTGPRQQPAAGGKTGEPRSPRGTQLKATTNGLFWSRLPSKGRHRRGLFLLAPSADRVSPFQAKAASGCSAPASSGVSPQHVGAASHRPLTPDGRRAPS